MAPRIGFDNERYLEQQSAAILERVKGFDSKLYLEFGGKLLFDYHASRVLPGFAPNVKMQLLQKLRDQAEVVICIYAGDIEKKKMRADFGITYDTDTLKTIDDLREWNVIVRAVVITRFDEQPAAVAFKNRLERRGVRVYTHRPTRGYPADVDTIVSEAGYGANPAIETERPIVVVTGPGPGSGKLATCLSQLYHEHKRGVRAHYAKFETFPIWNLPLKHEVNVAYEAATAELKDVNLIDHFHLEAYGQQAVNYNRDLEAFPLLRRIVERITGEPSFYKSPTDMGVNRAGFGIVDDAACREASKQEIIRRYYSYACEYAMGLVDKETVQRVEMLMNAQGLSPKDRQVVAHAHEAARLGQEAGKGRDGICCAAALELKDGRIVTGKNSPHMHAAASLVLNAAKLLADIPDNLHLLPPIITTSLAHFKKNVLKRNVMSLDLEETLIALSISATMNPAASAAIEQLKELSGCDVHLTHIPSPGDAAGLRKLGVQLTSDPEFASKLLYLT
ncbi:DUF1846 domain-containing protein [Opitutus terrae]|uniref:ATP-dependent Zn protease n=1 Tax=Opitutus terrae (strain DSM 11246 / JCM 15787 / PB90-1) TaxID=452637 RepID=B1ZRH4_OPITP|nr:DUF1846 domain-containing protein [Opitutus terrae]ACB77624.1 Domain of unknown function DUF1846 [Opitutus terrae PB90-1]